jgi:hypothetical protein
MTRHWPYLALGLVALAVAAAAVVIALRDPASLVIQRLGHNR